MKQQTMTDKSIPFLVLFEEQIPISVSDEGETKKTDVIQETTDDD